MADTVHADLAWTYHYPLPAVAPIAGMVAFYNEKLDIVVDGAELRARRRISADAAGSDHIQAGDCAISSEFAATSCSAMNSVVRRCHSFHCRIM